MKHCLFLAMILFAVKAPCCTPLLEAKVGYFFFVDSDMNEVYRDGGIDLQLSGTYPIYQKWLQIYGSLEWLQKSGHSAGLGDSTELWELPVSVGLRGTFNVASHLNGYLTLGPRYFYAHVTNHSPYVNRHLHANTLGGFVNGGLLYTFCNGFTFDAFGEYSYGKGSFRVTVPNTQGHRTQVGGLTFGAGLGYVF